LRTAGLFVPATKCSRPHTGASALASPALEPRRLDEDDVSTAGPSTESCAPVVGEDDPAATCASITATTPTPTASTPSPGSPPTQPPLVVRIDGEWLDLSRWAAAHPAGAGFLELFRNRDATDVIAAIHSDEALARLSRLPRAAPEVVPVGVPADSAATLAFRAFRAELIADGWFERDWVEEVRQVAPWFLLMGCSVWMARAGGEADGSFLSFGPLASDPAGAALLHSFAWAPLGLAFCQARDGGEVWRRRRNGAAGLLISLSPLSLVHPLTVYP